MTTIRRLVLDVLKPHEPELITFTQAISDLEAVTGVTATLVEMDENVRSLKVAVEGDDLDHDVIAETIGDLGGSIHSVDEVSVGDHIVEHWDPV